MGNGNLGDRNERDVTAALLTPHGERERARDRVVQREAGELLTPHGEREQARSAVGRCGPHAPNPSWGTGTVNANVDHIAAGQLLTPHGERELVR